MRVLDKWPAEHQAAANRAERPGYASLVPSILAERPSSLLLSGEGFFGFLGSAIPSRGSISGAEAALRDGSRRRRRRRVCRATRLRIRRHPNPLEPSTRDFFSRPEVSSTLVRATPRDFVAIFHAKRVSRDAAVHRAFCFPSNGHVGRSSLAFIFLRCNSLPMESSTYAVSRARNTSVRDRILRAVTSTVSGRRAWKTWLRFSALVASSRKWDPGSQDLRCESRKTRASRDERKCFLIRPTSRKAYSF